MARETSRRIGVSALVKHHQLRRDLLVNITVSKKQSYFPRRRYANTPTRRHALLALAFGRFHGGNSPGDS